jgi:hypothetical protein
MQLQLLIEDYLHHPVSTGNGALLEALITHKWQKLVENAHLQCDSRYSTANVFLKRSVPSLEFQEIKKGVFMETPDLQNLALFYQEHHLEPISKLELESICAITQLKAAFDFLSYDYACGKHVETIVRCIQVLRQPEPEFDVSYSHPEIPFSIFVSIGVENSPNDVIRLAESVLHESMHLKLTLIENFSPLVTDNKRFFFSPWRSEERPVQGVLHGMYVFKAILDFYQTILANLPDPKQYDFVDWRIETIKSELETLKNFPASPGLSVNGAILARNLLP